MSQLTQGMYVRRGKEPSQLFGLADGQMCGGSDRLLKNHGWYNRNGEKLGWGDLAASNVQSICAGLAPGEVFVTVGEYQANIEFARSRVANPDAIPADVTDEKPGVDYVAANARFLFTSEKAYQVEDFGTNKSLTIDRDGVTYHVVAQDKVKALMTQ